MSGFDYTKDNKGIVTITMDMPGPVNAVNDAYNDEMATTLDRLEAETDLRGVIFTSAKKTFVAGGDLNLILSAKDGEEAKLFDNIEAIKADLRRIEKLPVPVVAAINGSALGGGYELALACNHRIVWDHKSVEIGLPEVGLGLLPGAGGVVRLTNLLGLEKALPFLLEGKKPRGAKAVEAGLVHESVDTLEALLPRAKAWILESDPETSAIQPWDQRKYKIPGGDIWHPKIAQTVMVAPHMLKSKTRGLMPAPERILETAVEAVTVGFDAALRVETRKLVSLITTPQAKNMINTLFFQLNSVNSGASRPQGVPPTSVSKLGVIGAGMMGQGIAYVAAKAGIDVVLKDISQEAANKGKAYSEGLLDKAIARGRGDQATKDRVLGKILATDQNNDLQGCDLIIEAVFEDMDLKDKIVEGTENQLAEGGVWASNTSTLPITRLAEASSKPDNFIGMHFFSPVDKMPLVEIICGEKTSDETLAKAFDLVRQIKKTPIVVNDSLGFFTSRAIGSQMIEAVQLLRDGVDPVRIENCAKAIGMPVGPLTLYDEVSLQFLVQVHDSQLKAGLRKAEEETHPEAWALLESLVEDHNRIGRKGGDGGFYTYTEDGKSLWYKLNELYTKPEVDSATPDQDIKDRLLFSPVIESVKCLEEGVLRSVPDGNIGSIFGIGAPPWTGGYIQFINTYGLDRFDQRCEELAKKYGAHFQTPKLVKEKIKNEELFV